MADPQTMRDLLMSGLQKGTVNDLGGSLRDLSARALSLPPLPPTPAPFNDPMGREQQAFPMPPDDPTNPYPAPTRSWGNRVDGTPKGNGFLGPLIRPDGTGVSSEISIGVNMDGKEVEIPTLVPTLSPSEVQFLLTQDYRKGFKMPDAIVQKAVAFARQRQAQGQPAFAAPGEENLNLHPVFRRVGQRP